MNIRTEKKKREVLQVNAPKISKNAAKRYDTWLT